jgi:hypothetical protein
MFAIAILAVSFLLATGKLKKRTEVALLGKSIIGVLAGMVIIGRYNQTSIVFLFPLLYIMVLFAVDYMTNSLSGVKLAGKYISVVLLILIVASVSFVNILPWLKYDYKVYTSEIAKVVTPENKVLANLNSEFYFENGNLLDYRNLSYLKDVHLSVEEYIRKNKIEYIILSDEMDMIYSQRPVWNIIYGNLRYMDELHLFLNQKCTLVHGFQNNIYGVRIVQFMRSDRDFTVQIFKVKDFS